MGTTAAQRAAMKLARGKYTKESWDSKIPPKEYFEQIRRVTRKQIIWGGNYFLDYLGATDCMMLWDKEQGDLTFDDFEIAWTNLDCKCMVCKRSRVKDAKHEKIHQTQKPVYLYRWIFSKLFKYGYLKKGQRVLDTHGGSHNIAIAAYEFGLHLTVLEISMEHHLNGIENFKNKTRQGVFDYDC
jgi:site-specific DNA-methyltransferase (adenine-specific)